MIPGRRVDHDRQLYFVAFDLDGTAAGSGSPGEWLPVFGTCAGMIMLADRIEDGVAETAHLRRHATPALRRNAFGRQVDSFERDVTLRLGDNADEVAVSRCSSAVPWVSPSR